MQNHFNEAIPLKWLLFYGGEMSKRNISALSTGFALFSMFFGSGNLVFPIAVGQASAGAYWAAALGMMMTGVIVPFLGVFGMLLYEGELSRFFSFLGKKGLFIFTLITLCLLGPFGVLARCLTVAHGAVQLMFPEISLELTSFILCALILILTRQSKKILQILGAWLTPFLLISIGLIALIGLYQSPLPNDSGDQWTALLNGCVQGYQTMDLLAAFFFSHFIIKELLDQKQECQKKGLFVLFAQSALIGGCILSTVYVALVLLGSSYAHVLDGKSPQELFGVIAVHSLGSYAAPVVCVAVVFACLTTALVLTTLFADFLTKEIGKERIGRTSSLIITLIIGFLISTLDFVGISNFLGPILEMIYPILIFITLWNLGIQCREWIFPRFFSKPVLQSGEIETKSY